MKSRLHEHARALAVALLLGALAGQAGAARADTIAAAGVGGQDCTYTVGYWKAHPADWPVTALSLGSVPYTAAQLGLILAQPPAGNGLVTLAHQLVAARLNLEQGAQPAPSTLGTLAQADALIGALVCPPVGSGSLAPGATSALVTALDTFNTGKLGPWHCGSTSSRPPTWGAVKTIYR